MDALAFARGLNIHLAPGQEAHLPHEGWHVVQQLQGRVRPSASTAHTLVTNDLALEQEADRMGAKANLIGREGVVRPSLAMPQPVAAGPIQLRPRNKKKAEAAAAESAAVEALWFADELFNAPLDQIGPMLDGIAEDARALSATLDTIDRFAPGAEGSREERRRHSMIHIGLINRLDALEQNEQAVAGFEKAVKSARNESGRGLIVGGEPQKQMVAILDSAGTKTLKKIERMLLLWPEAGKAPTMRDIVDLITSRSRQSAAEESKRGRFDLAEGESAAQSLQDQVPVLVEEEKARVAKINEKEEAENQRRLAQGLGELELTKVNFNKCLKLLSTVESRSQLHPGEEDAALRARIEYERGIKERSSGLHSKATLSRYAQELRLEGLVGPVTIVQAAQGPDLKHVPAMTDLFDKFSDAGDGWYFFYVSVVSLHTVFVGVKSEGGSKSYFLIQMPPTNMDARTKDKLEDFFDGWSNKGASTKVWQVYDKKSD